MAPDSAVREKSVEVAKQSALQLETVRYKLEAERAKQEDHMNAEREGKDVLVFLSSTNTWHCIILLV